MCIGSDATADGRGSQSSADISNARRLADTDGQALATRAMGSRNARTGSAPDGS